MSHDKLLALADDVLGRIARGKPGSEEDWRALKFAEPLALHVRKLLRANDVMRKALERIKHNQVGFRFASKSTDPGMQKELIKNYSRFYEKLIDEAIAASSEALNE